MQQWTRPLILARTGAVQGGHVAGKLVVLVTAKPLVRAQVTQGQAEVYTAADNLALAITALVIDHFLRD